MAKKRPAKVPAEVVAFARGAFFALEYESWGDIDPLLFRSIGEGRELDDDAVSLIKVIKAGLKAVKGAEG